MATTTTTARTTARAATKAGAGEVSIVGAECCAAVGSAEFDELDAAELAKGFAALADPVRLHLLSLITAGGLHGACVCDLVGPSGRSQPTVSHHLKVLRDAGLVTSEKRGTWAWYHVVSDRLARLKNALG